MASIERSSAGASGFQRFAASIGLGAVLVATALAGAAPLSAQAAQPGLLIKKLSFQGNRAFPDDLLAAAIQTSNSSFFVRSSLVSWLGLGTERYLNEREFRRDVFRIRLFYHLHGYLEARVDTVVARTETEARITFVIDEGPPVRVRTFDIKGLDSLPRRRDIVEDLPLRIGEPYDRTLLLTTADTIALRMQDRGYPWVRVLLDRRDLDSAGRAADLSLVVEPGPAARFGGIRIEGTRKVDSAFVRKLLAARPGRPYRGKDVVDSRINLYRSELFRYATVQTDTARLGTDSTTVPLLVSVTEGYLYRVRAAGGYGTDDCFRLGVGWLARNVFGRGQAFEVSGQVSKVGIGDPTSVSPTRDFLCRRLRDDSLGSGKMNYAVATSFRRPTFLSPQNALTLSLFAERRSEFQVYRREDVGGSLTLTRETSSRNPISLTYRLSYGATEAQPVSFCAFFNACTEDDIARLRDRRLLATLTLGWQRVRLNNPLDPTRGSALSLETAHSSRIIGSSELNRFTRLVGDAAWFYPVGRMVVAAHARAGIVFAPPLALGSGAANFVPPEQRFYAGGANDVRGFDRNELGPIVYTVPVADDATADIYRLDPDAVPVEQVRFAPTGANTLLIGNLELRVPSPVLSNNMRLGFFVDAGAVWDRGAGTAAPRVRFTPGAGIRYNTPLGPAR
ncbi:MAG TPA: BamA/TamA family outer membrane protein, partial [Gemmatimonadales bacterium]|nr:BamA/TamA family outer membrane protein [Gemmatimonadales bacterium]